MSRFANAAVFQAGWFASILSAANDMPWTAAMAALAVVAAHLWLTPDFQAELKLVLAAGLIGAIWENALALAGWTVFQDGQLISNTAPLWMVAQWMLFATTLNLSLSWLKPRLAVAALFGAIGAPLSYLAGERLGALSMPQHQEALIALALGWAVLTPSLVLLARRWDGSRPAPPITLVDGVRHA